MGEDGLNGFAVGFWLNILNAKHTGLAGAVNICVQKTNPRALQLQG